MTSKAAIKLSFTPDDRFAARQSPGEEFTT